MKKLLSILGAITLAGISTTTLIACNKPDNSEKGGDNKLEPWKIHNNHQKIVIES